jgi:hypothetical protein
MTAETIPWYADLTNVLEASVFEQEYARASNVTVQELHIRWGRFAELCDCDDSYCLGWQMGHQWEDAIFEDMEREGK